MDAGGAADPGPGTRAALVLFSGGQDSTTCLAWALERYARVETVGFDYGQRHRIELDCRGPLLARLKSEFRCWGERLGEDHLLEVPVLGRISDTALTRQRAIAVSAGGLPDTFVPARNLLFFTLAAALGWRRGLLDLVGGMCETDYSGYPDCRDETLQTLARAIALGTDAEIAIVTPLMRVDKAGTWAMAHALGGDALVALIRDDTHSCYLGDRLTRHPWGAGCGHCPACRLRAAGWFAWTAQRT